MRLIIIVLLALCPGCLTMTKADVFNMLNKNTAETTNDMTDLFGMNNQQESNRVSSVMDSLQSRLQSRNRQNRGFEYRRSQW